MGRVPWQAVAEHHQRRRAAAIPPEWAIPATSLQELQSTARVFDVVPRLLPDHVLQITALGASDLAGRIRDRTYSALEVTEAFCHRAAVAQQLTNCLTEIFFSEALEQARQLDRVLESMGKTVGPLHGVPVSVKDHYNIRGQYTTAGFISYAQNGTKSDDAHVVEIMRNAGAVLYAKTNNPQCMMVLETVSNIYGRTLNPWNTRLGAGGSSGGEGALLALHGSPLGIGSDVGGSIRVPAAFNGLYGFKPSGKRVPISGWECSMAGAESITAVSGPLAHNVKDLELFFQIVSDAKPWLKEPVLTMPWRAQERAKKLTIGLMLSDNVVTPHPYITRVLNEAAQKLRNAGHEVFDFEPYDHRRAWDDILLPLYFTDGGADTRQTVEAGDEPMLPSALRLISDPIVRERSLLEVWKLHLARDAYRMEYLKKWAHTAHTSRSGRPMDVLICPVAPLQGTPHDVKPWWGYCSHWNLLDYPSGVLPAGKVLSSDEYPEGYCAMNDLDAENVALYDNAAYLGMPVAIQVVGPTQQDEMVLAAMDVIDRIVNG